MPRADTEKWNYAAKTGNADTLVAGSVIGGNALDMGRILRGSLSALVTVDCETSTLTMTAKWQVSKDNSTWVDLVPSNNAANVTLATGTAGADADVVKAIEAPSSAFGWKYGRLAILTGVATANAVDTYSIGYCFRDLGADQL